MFNRSTSSLRALASLNAFTFSGAQGFLITLYPYFAERLQLSLPALIGSFSLGSFLFLFGSPYWAAKSDKWGRRKVLTIGIAALLISFAILVFLAHGAENAPLLCLIGLLISRFIYGLIASSIVPVAQSLQADLSAGHDPTRSMFIHSVSLSLGRVASLGAFIALGTKIQNMLFIVLAWIAVVFVINVFFQVEGPAVARASDETASWKHDLPNLKGVLAIAFLFTCFIEALNSSLTGSLKGIFQISSQSAAELGARILLICGIGILFLQMGRAFLSRISWSTAMAIGVGSLFTGSLVFAWTDSSSHLWVAFALLSVGTGLVPPLYLSLLRLNKGSRSYGKQAGMIGSAQTLGYAVGAGVSALAFHIGVQRIGYVLCAVASLLALACIQQRRTQS